MQDLLERPSVDMPPVKVVMAPRTSAAAMTGFVFSMLWLGGVGSIIGIVLGWAGTTEIDGSRGQLRGSRIAGAAVVIGCLGLILTILGLYYMVRTMEQATSF